jgi:hypothetical protein
VRPKPWRLKHDGVVGVFGVFEHLGTVYSALELIDGTTIASWLGNRKTPTNQAELDRISNKVLDALVAKHVFDASAHPRACGVGGLLAIGQRMVAGGAAMDAALEAPLFELGFRFR